jgi:hypothetical protein
MIRMVTPLLCAFSLLLGVSAKAQKFNFSVGLNLGASRLYHNTHFESTALNNLYKTIEITHREGYEWEQFEKDFELRDKFSQLRFGFFVRATHRTIPLILIGEAMSSTSTYEQMAYSGTLGFGKEFYILHQEVYCNFLAGYKLVWDKGFGASTMVNSIGHNEARSLVATYFGPVRPLGTNKGNLFVVRGGIGKTVDRSLQWTVGVDAYGELDLTSRLKREARMTNAGFNLFLRYNLQKQNQYAAFNNNPNFYR